MSTHLIFKLVEGRGCIDCYFKPESCGQTNCFLYKPELTKQELESKIISGVDYNEVYKKSTLFDEVLKELNKADIIYYQRCNSDGSFDTDDKNIKAIEIFCNVIEKYLTR